MWTITLSGAVLCYSSQNIFQFNFTNDISTISLDYKRKIAVALMTVIVQRFEAERAPLRVTDFAAYYHMPSRLVTQLLHEMVAAKLLSAVAVAEEETAYQPAIDPSKITLGLVVGRLNAQGTDDFIPEFDTQFHNLIATVEENMQRAIDSYDKILLRDIPLTGAD